MFKTVPVTESAPVEVEPAAEVVPLSVLQLDLGEPSTGWASHLAAKDIPIVLDDLGRSAISRDAARRLFDEHRENETRKAEMRAAAERAAVESDQRWRASLPRGLHWTEIPVGVTAAEVWAQAEKDAQPKRRGVLQEALSQSSMTFHSFGPTPDES